MPPQQRRRAMSAMSIDQDHPNAKPTVVGLYGLPGSGKTYLLNQMKNTPIASNENLYPHLTCHGYIPTQMTYRLAFFEGSEVLAKHSGDGGLEAFKRKPTAEKDAIRTSAIEAIAKECTSPSTIGVITGHFQFCSGTGDPTIVWTQADAETYTHVFYLDVPPEDLLQQVTNDKSRTRESLSTEQLLKWQNEEKNKLRALCHENGILFAILRPEAGKLLPKALTLLRAIMQKSEMENSEDAALKSRTAFVPSPYGHGVQTVLVMDADRTLAPQDTGALIWEKMGTLLPELADKNPLKMIFQEFGYSYEAFLRVTWLYEMYEATADPQSFESLCQEIASSVVLYPQIEILLRTALCHRYVRAVIITCGIGRVWEIVLERRGLRKGPAGEVIIISGGRIDDGFVVTPAVKAEFVKRLQDSFGAYVFAFGDGPVDIKMLVQADEAVVVVGDEGARSKTMDALLEDAITDDNFHARQALLPVTASPRLDTDRLPLVEFSDEAFLRHLFADRIQVKHATTNSASWLISTPMRDARVQGPALREIHRKAGWYLAVEYLMDVLGTEKIDIPHVQGNMTQGHQLLREKDTTIMALMRGGEPMALGVNDAFPQATFIHANSPEGLTVAEITHPHAIVLVDSVVNSGKTIIDFIKVITNTRRQEHVSEAEIVVIAGVVHRKAIDKISRQLAVELGVTGGTDTVFVHHVPYITMIALRLSDNQYTGRGGTDTGNRLFQTTHRD